MLLKLLVPLIIVLMSSALTFRKLIKCGGLDPALINYSNLLTRGNFWPLRILFFISLSLFFIWRPAGQFLLTIVSLSLLLQLTYLTIFSRLPTQPSVYFALISLAAAVLVLNLAMPFAIYFFAIAEICLLFWARHQKYFYDNWVAKKARRILTKFNPILSKVPTTYRLDVLHVATTEDIARPAIVRLAERIYFRLKKPAVISTGIMQVRDTHPISDNESMLRGSLMLTELLQKMPNLQTEAEKLLWISREYNDSESYAELLAATLPGVKQANKY